jgi:hypothetical protein
MHRLSFAEAGELARRAAAVARRGGVDDHAALTAMVTAARALAEAGETAEARALLQEAATGSRGRHPDIDSYATIEDRFTKLWNATGEEWDELVRIAPPALAVLEERGNDVALARAYELAAFDPWGRCQFHAAEQALERAEVHARHAGDSRVRGEILGWLGGALVWGPCPVDDALARCGRMLEDVKDEPAVLAGLLYARGALEAMGGDFERARASCTSGAAVLEELRLTPSALYSRSEQPRSSGSQGSQRRRSVSCAGATICSPSAARAPSWPAGQPTSPASCSRRDAIRRPRSWSASHNATPWAMTRAHRCYGALHARYFPPGAVITTVRLRWLARPSPGARKQIP